jgi:hypothetical protein
MPDLLPQYNQTANSGRGFISSVLAKLPYINQAVRDITDTNPKYEIFARLSKRRDEYALKQSVVIGPEMQDDYNLGGIVIDNAYHQFLYAKIDTDKIRRLAEYRRMAGYSEVSDCLDEISDEVINVDENGDVIKFKLNGDYTSEIKSELTKEFNKFIQIFDLENKGWGYFRQLLIDGELFFENIVSHEKPHLGVLNTINIPSELINPVYDNVQNNIVQSFILRKPITDEPKNPSTPTSSAVMKSQQEQIIIMEPRQVTYISSALWNEDKTIRLPFIENCRRSYKQLSLIEDSIVIYRLVRAPERLKFIIDVGNMPPHKAESYMQRLMHQYWNKKAYDSTKGGAQNIYDPQSMLDSYWFPKRTGESGSDVQVLQGGQNLGQLDDLMYFVNKLYKSLKVPVTRLNPNETFKDGNEILKDELKFAKFIIRLQQQFAYGVKTSFISHLKLRGWWKDYKLKERDITLKFNAPTNFFALREQQLFGIKQENFNNITSSDSIAKTFAQRHYLKYTDDQISENMAWLRKDAALRWELAQIEAAGPNWREQQAALAQAAAGTGGMGGGMGGGMDGGMGGGAEFPEFGDGAAPATPEAGGGAEAGAPAPEAGVAAGSVNTPAGAQQNLNPAG